ILFGFVCLQFVQTLFGRRYKEQTGLYFWPFFLLNPYTLQCASIADTDSTIYGPLLCGFLLSIVALMWADGRPRTTSPSVWGLMLSGTLLALCLWAKLTTVLLFIPASFFFFLFRFGWSRSFRFWLAIIGTGMGLFVLTFLFWCSWMHVSYTTHLH